MKRTSPPISEIDSFNSGLIVILLLTFFSLIFTSFSSPETSITSSSPSCSETFLEPQSLYELLHDASGCTYHYYHFSFHHYPHQHLPYLQDQVTSVFDFALFLASISLFCLIISSILPDMPVKPALEGSVCFLESSL